MLGLGAAGLPQAPPAAPRDSFNAERGAALAGDRFQSGRGAEKGGSAALKRSCCETTCARGAPAEKRQEEEGGDALTYRGRPARSPRPGGHRGEETFRPERASPRGARPAATAAASPPLTAPGGRAAGPRGSPALGPAPPPPPPPPAASGSSAGALPPRHAASFPPRGRPGRAAASSCAAAGLPAGLGAVARRRSRDTGKWPHSGRRRPPTCAPAPARRGPALARPAPNGHAPPLTDTPRP